MILQIGLFIVHFHFQLSIQVNIGGNNCDDQLYKTNTTKVPFHVVYLKVIRIKLNMRLKEDIPHDKIYHGKRNTPGNNAREDRPSRLALLVVIIHNTATSKLSISIGNPTGCLR